MAPSRRPTLFPAALLLVSAVFAGCGTGVALTGWLTGESGNGRAPAPPQLSISADSAPLKIDESVFRTLTVSNHRIDVNSPLRLELHGADAVQGQTILGLSFQGNTSTLLFQMATLAIYRRVQSNLRNVEANLHLFVGTREVAPPIPITLFREPEIEFTPPSSGPVFVSVDGTTTVQLRARFLRADRQEDADVEFLLRQPEHPPGDPKQAFRVQRATSVTFDFVEGRVTALCPPHPHAGIAGVQVRDSRAGTSALLVAYYIPSVQFPVPVTGVIDGGETVTLSGVGLVPEEHVNGRAEPQWDKISLWVRKGGTVAQVDPAQILREFSGPSLLQFRMPPSPDGEPGPAAIILRSEFPDFTTYDTVIGGAPEDRRTFRYGRSGVQFLRKFTLLPEGGRTFAAGAFDDVAGGAPALDVAVVTGSTEIAPSRVNFLTGTGSGLFFRRGTRVNASDPLQSGQARCAFLLAGRIRRGAGPDLLAVHRGTGTMARHAPLLLRLPASAPFELYTPGDNLVGAPDACGAAVGDLDEDGLSEFFVLSRPGGVETTPEVFESSDPGGLGNPPFARRQLMDLPQSAGRSIVAEDLDGDGHLDLAYAGSQSPVMLSVLFGDGRGGFLATQSLPCEVPGFAVTGDLGARALVALRGGQGTVGHWHHLAVVMAGQPASSTAPPAVVTVTFDPLTGRYRPPGAPELVAFPTETAALHTATGGDLDADGRDDLFLAPAAGALEPLRVLVQDATGHLQAAPGAVPPPEGLGNGIIQLQFVNVGDAATPRPAVLALHDFTVGRYSQRVLSAWLVRNGRLSPTDGSTFVPQVPVKVVAGGLLSGSQNGLPDLAVADAAGLTVLGNDGTGSFAGATPSRLDVPGILPRTLVSSRRSGAAGHCLSFVTQDGRLGCVLPGAPAPVFAAVDLRVLCGPPFGGAVLADDCESVVADVDRDGCEDVVLLLRPTRSGSTPLGEGDARILFLKGLDAAQPFPFRPPADSSFVAAVHGEARGIHPCNLLGPSLGAGIGDPLELAVAVKGILQTANSETNHVRFFRFLENDTQRDDDGVFQRSAEPGRPDYLVAGDQPTALQTIDVDGDGMLDLVVLGESSRSQPESLVRLIFNRMPVNALEVDVTRLQETAQSPESILGAPRALAAADINGDVQPELMVLTHTSVPQSVLATLRLVGAGFPPGGPMFVSADLAGPGAFSAFLLQDLDADGVPDLVVLRDQPGTALDLNVRVLSGTPQ